MTEVDRFSVLRDLDARHDEVIAELGSLEAQVERVLSLVRPPSSESAMAGAGTRSKVAADHVIATAIA